MSLMDRKNSFDSFEFDDDAIINEEIKTVTYVDNDVVVVYGLW